MDNDQATLTSQEIEIAAPEPTMAETMADTLASIRSRDGGDDDSATPSKADKPRDEKGKFSKVTETSAADVSQAEPDTGSKPAEAAPAEKSAAPVVTIDSSIQPPSSYTPEGKAAFAKADPAIQKEILKRESDFHRYYKEVEPLKQAANFGQEIYKAIKPFEEAIRSWGVPPAQAIQALFNADHKLTHGSPSEKIQAFAELAKGYGIDLSQGLPESKPLDPNVEYLQRQNQQALQAAQAAQQRIQQLEATHAEERKAAEQAQLNSVIEQAKQGKPHFDELKYEIGMILQSSIDRNQPISIDQAYEAAMWQSPTHRAELLAKQQADAEAAAARKRAEDAEKAKAARQASSVNVQKRGTLQPQKPVGEIKDFMREKLAEIRSR